MGCHARVYKKISALTDEEKNDILQFHLNDISRWWGFKLSLNEVIDEVKSWIEQDEKYGTEEPLFPPNMNVEKYAKDMIEKYTEILEDLNKNGFESDYILSNKYRFNIDLKKYRGEKYYKITVDSPFRVFGYPGNNFTNKKRLLNWLKKQPPHMIGFYKQDEDNDWHFIEGYTDELEERITDFFEKHGERNLLFNFG